MECGRGELRGGRGSAEADYYALVVQNRQQITGFMVNLGLLACGQSWSSAFCLARLIECVASVAMLAAVAVLLVRRWRKQRRVSFYIIVSVLMMLTLGLAFAFDTDLQIFNFLYLYFYNTYFSIIVFKLATKVLEKYKPALLSVFIVYALLVIAVLVYRIVNSDIVCQELPFLIASSFNLTVAIVFLALGINHIKWQQEKIDESLPETEQNNPMPRFRIWIALNCVGQAMVLVQTVVFEVKGCVFSANSITNEVVSLIFVFACFHLGMISTLYFFSHSAPDIKSRGMIRKTSSSSANAHPRMEIELVYHEEEARNKKVSML